jgi:hypothetical protein
MRVRILVKVGAAVLVAAASSIAMAQHQAPYPMQSDSASSGTRPEGTAATTKRKAAAKRATRSTLSGGGDSFEPRGFSSGGGVSPSSGAYVPPH